MSQATPNVLIISHNALSDTQNNGKTMSSFFRGWPKEHIAQIFLSYEDPDFSVCERFYRILDTEVLRNALRGGELPGQVINAGSYESIAGQKAELSGNRLYTAIRNIFVRRTPIATVARNFFWNRRRWITEGLTSWLDEFSPDIVFFQSSNCAFAFDMVRYICERYSIPLVMETTDDYVTGKFTLDPFFWIDHAAILKRYRWAAKYAYCTFAIGDKMAEEYSRRFGGRFEVAMNSVELTGKPSFSEPAGKQKLLFAGNLGLNRWKVVEKAGRALAELGQEGIADAELEICSLVPPPDKILRRLTIPGRMSFIGALNSEQLAEKREQSTLLLHVEAFDRRNRFVTRLSVSTKIPEYMCSGRCIMAIGPGDVASIEYLRDNRIGCVAASGKPGDIKQALTGILGSGELRREYAERAYEIASRRHSRSENSAMIQSAIYEACEKNRAAQN